MTMMAKQLSPFGMLEASSCSRNAFLHILEFFEIQINIWQAKRKAFLPVGIWLDPDISDFSQEFFHTRASKLSWIGPCMLQYVEFFSLHICPSSKLKWVGRCSIGWSQSGLWPAWQSHPTLGQAHTVHVFYHPIYLPTWATYLPTYMRYLPTYFEVLLATSSYFEVLLATSS